ncbi:ABC transporter ATP-binding protein [Alphaproteobacteria bacterium]|nr:ABC transporter ATP-binding protein [Alphaproteobacteria bacterium]
MEKQAYYVAALLFSSALLGGCCVASPYMSKIIIDVVSNTHDDDIITGSIYLVVIFVAYQVINNIAWRISSYIVYKLQLKTKSDVIHDICDYLYEHSYGYFQNNLAGKLSNNIRTIADCSELTIYDLSRITISFVLLIVSMFCMYHVHMLFFGGLMVWSVVFGLISLVVFRKIFQLSEDYSYCLSNVFGIISDCIANAINIKAFSNEKYEMTLLANFLSDMNESFRRKELAFLKVAFFQGLCTSLLVSIMLCLLVFLRSKNLVTLGDFVLILGLSFQITDHIWNCTEIIHKINSNTGMCNQCMFSLFTPIEIADKKDAKVLSVKECDIIYDHVSFGYKNMFFENLNVKIQSKEKIGLVGHSGSGKTTFINLLLRFYELNFGNIYINKTDISGVTQASLRSCISLVSQDAILFHRSVIDNIKYGCTNASKDDVIKAAKYANAHEFIEHLSNGYDTIIGERGVKLSGGQRQRISIARAILKDAPILVMDEATSQLDSITEMYLQEALDELMKNKTVIIAAHRISTISKMDRIFVFNNGAIECCGSHDYLIENSDTYKQLWKKLKC